MPRKPRTPSREDQARLDKEYSEKLAEYRRQLKSYNKAIRDEKKEKDKNARSILKEASKVGLYRPKSLELTPYRKRRARQLRQDFGEYLNKDKFFFLPANPEARRRILERAQQLHFPTSRTGIFVAKEGYKKARIRKNRKHDEFEIIRSGKVKKGPNRGKIYKDLTPLPSVDELEQQIDRIRDMAHDLGPFEEGDQIAFEVIEQGKEGYSRTVYIATEGGINKLLEDLRQYHTFVASEVHFLRHVRVVKTTSKVWRAEHPPKSPRRTGRIRRSRNVNTRGSKG